MEQPKSVEEQQFEHSINNTRIENERNELLAHIKARVEAQAKSRSGMVSSEKLERAESRPPCETNAPGKT